MRSSGSAYPMHPHPAEPALLHKRRLRGGEPHDRHAERRGDDVVEADLLEEANRVRISAMFAADTDLQVLARGAPALHANVHELADAADIDRRERILLDDLELGVVR